MRSRRAVATTATEADRQLALSRCGYIGSPMKWITRFFVLLLAVAVAAAGAALWWLYRPLPLAAASVEASIEPGTTPRQVAQLWADAGVRTEPLFLYEWFRWSGDAKRIRAGSYKIDAGATPRDLLAKMVRGDEELLTVRLIDGWTLRQWREVLARAPSLQPTTQTMSEAELMAALGSPGVPAEGRFFPDTYAYSKGVSDLTVLKRAHAALQRRLDEAWAARAPDTPLKSPAEALILASIIEKETGIKSDRGKVAGVFVNRLRQGMPLQTDPTVIYGLGTSFDGNLRKRDLQTDHPFNTYQRAGLPPTPIAMPGLESLRAAVQPEKTSALYFVARGDGSSVFSDTLAEHNRAVNQYQRKRK